MSSHLSNLLVRAEEEGEANCGSKYNGNELQGLRIGAIFIVLATSAFGTLLPIVTGRVRGLGLPKIFYETVKYFGSGVIVATAFMHLLAEAFEALSNEECLSGAWKDYDWSPAIAMAAVFFIFFAEFFASRAGAAYLDKRGMQYDNHGHDLEGSANVHASHGTEISATNNVKDRKSSESDRISTHTDHHSTYGNSAIGMMTGVTILEFGVLFHSAILGLTLATTGSDEFRVLLIVIVFHQMFEGLGLGARLAELPLKKAHNWIPYVAATAYFILTPIFIAIGLGVRKTYNDESTAALIVSGILDSLSGGVLLYTGIVELLAHDFIYSEHMKRASLPYVLYASFCVLLGAGLMSLLAYWA